VGLVAEGTQYLSGLFVAGVEYVGLADGGTQYVRGLVVAGTQEGAGLVFFGTQYRSLASASANGMARRTAMAPMVAALAIC